MLITPEWLGGTPDSFYVFSRTLFKCDALKPLAYRSLCDSYALEQKFEFYFGNYRSYVSSGTTGG